MQSNAKTVEEYISELPPERKVAMEAMRKVIKKNLPKGFKEEMSYGMIGYVVPHSLYPPGYHCDPKLPLPFLAVASQKNFIALYHMGVYANPELNKWFVSEYAKVAKSKMDMGKSCIRFKKPEQIPLALIGELASKTTPSEWIAFYESKFRNKTN